MTATPTTEAFRIVRFTAGGQSRYMDPTGRSVASYSDAATFADEAAAHEGAAAHGWIRGAYSISRTEQFGAWK